MPGLKTSKKEHQAMEAAILEALRTARGPLTFEGLLERVARRVPADLFPTRNRIMWYAKTIQLDLEHHGRIERLEEPLRFRIPSGEKRTLRQVYHIKASPSDVWKMLIDPRKIQVWSGTPAVMKAAVGTEFSLWNGEIHGRNLEVLPERKLVQEWQEQDWREPSQVTFLLKKKEQGITTVELVHEGIPRERLQDIAKGWDEYYLGAIKQQFG